MKKRVSTKRRKKIAAQPRDYKNILIEEDTITPLDASFLSISREEG